MIYSTTVFFQAAKCSASNWLRKESKENTAPIDILTDARHGWRKNARQTDVICIGNDTKKVVAYKVVTSDDDPIAQRHELIGTKDIYNQMDLNNVLVGKHAHDNNSSITKYVRVSRKSTINQLDNWHALKQLEKTIKLIGAGTKKTKYASWHPQLEDNAHAIRTHAFYCLVNCDKDTEKLKAMLINCVSHYKGEHDNCSLSSRCRRQDMYEPRHVLITDTVAEDMLRKALQKSIIYAKAEHFVFNMSTAHVESFNNTLNTVHDKRISFGMRSYKMKTALAVGNSNDTKSGFSAEVWNIHIAKLKG